MASQRISRAEVNASVPTRLHRAFMCGVLAAALLGSAAPDALAAGTTGSISGNVKSSVTNQVPAGAKVQFYDLNGNSDGPVATAIADPVTGNYTQTLPDSSYGVITQNSDGLINKIWNNVPCSAVCNVNSITGVTVAGNAVTNINFILDPGGRIAGTVTDAATGLPIAGATVLFLDPGPNVPFSSAVTDASGHYISDGGSATGTVYVGAIAIGYQAEMYDNIKCPALNCDPPVPANVAVTLGATTNNIDFALDPGGRISGTVTNANGTPLANVEVRTFDSTGDNVDETFTDASGNWTSTGLPSGTYYVGTRRSGYADKVWTNLVCAGDFCGPVNGTPISVTVPNTTTGINFVLGPGSSISGTVTAAAGGAPVANAQIAVFNAAGQFVGAAFGNNAGAYTVTGLPTGVFFAGITFNLPNGFLAQAYNHISCANNNCAITNSTPIPVTAGTPVTNIDFSLLATGTGTITGTVTNSSAAPLNNVQVVLVGMNGVQQVMTVNTIASGAYTFSNVPAGSYYVRTNSGSFINEVYPNIVCLSCNSQTSGGQLVTVTNGGTTANINFALDPGARFSGTITRSDTGAPVGNIGVQIFNAAGTSVGQINTNNVVGPNLGTYTSLGLPPGTYYARTTNTQGFVNKQWSGLDCPQAGCQATAGTPIVVAGTATTPGIDFVLTTGGLIAGQLTDATTHAPLTFQNVTLFSSAGVNLGNLNTGATGNYTSQGLPAGNYYLRTATGTFFLNNQQLGYIDQLWNGTVCVPACLFPTAGTPIAVTSGNTTSGINFALTAAGSVSGAVVDAAALTTGLGSVGIQIYTAAGVFAKSTTTNSFGGYLVGGLPEGTYYAKVSSGASQFYEDELFKEIPCGAGCTVTAGTPVIVPNLGMAMGVDFTLSAGAGSISGTVTDVLTSAPLSAVTVQIYTPGGVFVKQGGTGVTGTFAIGGLTPGNYVARTAVVTGSIYADQIFDGMVCGSTCTVTAGTAIVVTAGTTRTGVDFKLTVKTIELAPTALSFTGTNTSGTLSPLTPPQTVAVTFPFGWSAAADQPWVQITNGSGTGDGTFTVGIINPNNVLGGTTNATATVTVTPSLANSAPKTVSVNLTLTITPPTMALDKSSLQFAATSSGTAFIQQTGGQTVRLTQTGGSGTVTWTASSNQPWITVSPAAGTGPATLTVGVKFDSSLPQSGTSSLLQSATSSSTVSLAFTGASNASASIAVALTTMAPETSKAPSGSFDTPQDNATGVTGSIPVTGWALDDLGIARVDVCRDPVSGENAPPNPNCAGQSLVFIGTAVLVDGARPDVANQNPATPRNTQAGWGYLMLTNFLPGLGNGTFTLHAIATDVEGNTKTLGTKTITCDNAHALKPFGAIDTPAQGETVSGTITNFGWVLAPAPDFADPPDGGTVTAFIDGTPLGSPGAWGPRPDLTALFKEASYPGVSKALAVLGIDTTSFANGVHAIFWIVTATNGQQDGVGSRFITIANSSLHAGSTDSEPAAGASVRLPAPALLTPAGTSAAELSDLVNSAPQRQVTIMGRRGFDLTAPFNSYGAESGPATMAAEELDRIELHIDGDSGTATAGVTGEAVAPHYTGYMRVGADLGPLPIGSHLDDGTGVFTWTPGVGFIRDYDLVFVRWSESRVVDRVEIRVTLRPRGTNRVGPQVTIDAPGPNTLVESPFLIGGWALDAGADVGTGVDSLHVWAYPACASGAVGSCGEPTFLGATAYGGTRPDVGAVFGERFTNSGFGLIVDTLRPGTYDLAVFAWSATSGRFAPASIVRVTVK